MTTTEQPTAAPLTTKPRFIALDADVYDEETGLVAGFPDDEHARLGAEWMNTGNATIAEYEWVETPPADIDEGPTIDDVIRAAEILQIDSSELVGALAPIFLAKRDQQKSGAAK